MNGFSFDYFKSQVAKELGLDPATVGEATRLVEDLGLDSLQMAELGLLLEDMGLHIPEELVWEIKTLGDVHRSCLRGANGNGRA